ncbi:hypothetical protein ACFLS0_01065 [Candidatus Bipolaricaulota bacterium]
MSAVQPEGMTDVTREETDVTREEIDVLRKQIGELDKKLEGRYFAPELQDLRLLDGLTQPEKYDKIKERLKANVLQKKSLSGYLTKLVLGDLEAINPETDHPLRLFIESGSTLAVFSAALAQEARADERLAILTNNFLALTAFGVGNTAVTGGTLERDYLAFLPFRNAHRRVKIADDKSIPELPPISEQDRIRDAAAYKDLETAIAGTDMVYTTASGFGFLLGPHVGSRANAIFKYCLYNNRARRRLRLCVTHAKVHCEGGWHEVNDVKNHVYKLCYTVFNRGSKQEWTAPLEQLSDVGVMKGKWGDSLPEQSESPRMIRSAPTELGLHTVAERNDVCEGYGLVGLASTWRALLEGYRPGALEIIIAMNPESNPIIAKKKLCRAYRQANRVLAGSDLKGGWGLNRQYVEKEGTEDDPSVLHIIVDEATARGDGIGASEDDMETADVHS